MTVIGDLVVEFKEKPARGEEPPVLTLTERNGFVRQSERFNKRLATEDVSGYKVVRRNDIAFNPYLLWAGAVAQNTILDEGIISPLYPTFRVREGNDPRYVGRLLLTPQLIRAYDGIAFGSVPRRRRSSVADFLQLPLVLVPPLEEQRRIARILDDADALRAKRRRVLAHLSALTAAIFQDMFGERSFEVMTAGDLMPFMRNGISPSSAGTVQFRVLTLSAITQGAFDDRAVKEGAFTSEPPSDKRVSSLDFLMCRGNGNKNLVGVGVHSAVDRLELVFPDTVIAGRVDPGRVRMRFLEAAWSRPSVRRQIEAVSRTTNGTYKVNQKGLAGVKLDVPPIPMQDEFVSRVQRVQSLRETVVESRIAEDELLASLQSRAFRGDL